MLVLSRKKQESVIVEGFGRPDRRLKVTVLEISGRSVNLGFEADAAVPVHRLEVWEQVRSARRKRLATKAQPRAQRNERTKGVAAG